MHTAWGLSELEMVPIGRAFLSGVDKMGDIKVLL